MGAELTAKFTRNKVVEVVNVSQIINYLKTDIVDAGIAFDCTAGANNLSYIEIPPDYNHPEIAPLIRLTSKANEEKTKLFIDFIINNLAVFENKNGQLWKGSVVQKEKIAADPEIALKKSRKRTTHSSGQGGSVKSTSPYPYFYQATDYG